MATCTDGNNNPCGSGTGTGGSCGEEKIYHLLDLDGLKYILSKMRSKILLAVGAIRTSSTKPLNLWKDPDDDGITICGDIDTATRTSLGVVKVREENGLHITETGDDAGEVYVTLVTRTSPGTLSAKDYADILDRLTDIEEKLEELTSLTYSAPEVTLTYPDIDAGGGTASPTLTYRQKVTKGDGTVYYLENEGGEAAYEMVSTSHGATIMASSGNVTCTEANTTTSRRDVASVKVTVVMNGVEGSATATVYQAGAAEATRTYGDLTGTLTYPNDIPAEGGSSSPSLSYSLSWTDSDGNSGAITSGAAITWTFTKREAENLDFENEPAIDASTGVVTVGANHFDNRSNIGTAKAHIELEGKTLDLEANVYQLEPTEVTYTYGDVNVTLSYDDIPAEGGSVDPTVHYTQVVTGSDGSRRTITDEGGTLAFDLVE